MIKFELQMVKGVKSLIKIGCNGKQLILYVLDIAFIKNINRLGAGIKYEVEYT